MALSAARPPSTTKKRRPLTKVNAKQVAFVKKNRSEPSLAVPFLFPWLYRMVIILFNFACGLY